jgi:hypothetical protein
MDRHRAEQRRRARTCRPRHDRGGPRTRGPGQAEDWSVAQQKLALAYRGAGNLAEAQRLITIASTSGVTGTPMQKVRLSTAQAHILLSDTGTRAQGLALLDDTARLARGNGLSHQLRSIESIRTNALTDTP